LLLVWSGAWGAERYFAPESRCANNGDGTSNVCAASAGAAGMWRGDANIAWASVNPGDTLYGCGDWQPTDARITIEDSGAAGNYITLSGNAAACGRASNSTIDRTGLTGAGARAIAASNTAATRQYIRIEDLTIRNVSAGILWDYSTTGAVSDDTSLWVRRVKFENCGTSSGTDGDCIWKRGEGLIVEDSSFEGCWEDCIWYRGKGASIVRNRFSRVSFGGALGDCTQIDLTGVTDMGAVNWSRNHCDHTAADNKYGLVIGPMIGAGSSVLAYENIVLCPLVPTNPVPANQCHPLYFDAHADTAISIFRNFTQGGEVGISLTAASAAAFSTRAQIAGNIVYKASDRGIWTDANVDNIDIWNNVVSEAGQEALYIGKSGAALNANNNVLVNSGAGIFYITPPTSRGFNSYHGNALNVDVNGSVGSTTTGDVTSNPRFIGGTNPTTAEGFRPSTNSPLCGAGAYTDAKYDYNHERMPLPRDIGALNCRSSEARTRSSAGTRTARTIN